MSQKAASQERRMYDLQWYRKKAPRVAFQRKKTKHLKTLMQLNVLKGVFGSIGEFGGRVSYTRSENQVNTKESDY